MSLLETVIRNNYDGADKTGLTSYDILQLALAEEYRIFTTNKVVTMYRRGMAFLMAEIKSKTDKFIPHSILTKNDESDKKGNGNEEARAKNDNRETAVAEKGTSTLMDDRGGGGAAGKSGFSGFQTALQLSKKSNESHGDDGKVCEKKEVKSANNDKGNGILSFQEKFALMGIQKLLANCLTKVISTFKKVKCSGSIKFV